MEPKWAQQTKLTFTTTGTPENNKPPSDPEQLTTVQQTKLSFASAVAGTPLNTKAHTTSAITPEVNAGTNFLSHPTPPPLPERIQPDPPENTNKQNSNEQNKQETTESNNKITRKHPQTKQKSRSSKQKQIKPTRKLHR
jgi:hypothetical protein